MPADSSNPENLSSEDKLAVVIEAAAMNEVHFSEYCHSGAYVVNDIGATIYPS